MSDSLMLSFNLCQRPSETFRRPLLLFGLTLRISDISVSGMVVYRFEVFAFDDE